MSHKKSLFSLKLKFDIDATLESLICDQIIDKFFCFIYRWRSFIIMREEKRKTNHSACKINLSDSHANDVCREFIKIK